MPLLPDAEPSLLTVEQLAGETGLTVRTLRYYSGLALMPPPVRRGRVALYGREHVARLGLVRALQDHGFTMAAIQKAMARIPAGAGVEHLAVQRAVLTSWSPAGPEALDRRQLDERAGRPLDDEQVALLLETGVLQQEGSAYSTLPGFQMSVELLDVEVPADGIREAADVIERNMAALTEELTEVLRRRVFQPYEAVPRTDEESARLEVTMERLRALTLQAVVSGFQRATNAAISRSLR